MRHVAVIPEQRILKIVGDQAIGLGDGGGLRIIERKWWFDETEYIHARPMVVQQRDRTIAIQISMRPLKWTK